MFLHSPNALAVFLAAQELIHQRELRSLADHADEICQAVALHAPWTDTPGTDALHALHPGTAPPPGGRRDPGMNTEVALGLASRRCRITDVEAVPSR